MNRTPSISLISSGLIVVCYVVLAGIAFSTFSLPYSPIHNWLSDLGNPDINPSGAVFYNVGMVITAGLVLVFFLSLFRFRLQDNRIQNVMTLLTAIFGAAGSVGMLMSAIHPINQPAAHSAWCMVLFFSLGTAFAFSVAMFRYYRRYPRWLLVVGAIVALVNMGSQIFFGNVPICEWIIVTLFLSYCLLLGIATQRLGEQAS
jgi:hypothetical membrane protein